MPFKSRAQEKWAFATHQPFAKKWADITDQKSLPTRVGKSNRVKKHDGRRRSMRRLALHKRDFNGA
jgi:hypothetical protein